MPDIDDDETAFWREQRAQSHRPLTPDVDAMRDLAGTVVCPDCRAPVDEDCMNPLTGKSLRFLPCHPRRLTAARKAAS